MSKVTCLATLAIFLLAAAVPAAAEDGFVRIRSFVERGTEDAEFAYEINRIIAEAALKFPGELRAEEPQLTSRFRSRSKTDLLQEWGGGELPFSVDVVWVDDTCIYSDGFCKGGFAAQKITGDPNIPGTKLLIFLASRSVRNALGTGSEGGWISWAANALSHDLGHVIGLSHKPEGLMREDESLPTSPLYFDHEQSAYLAGRWDAFRLIAGDCALPLRDGFVARIRLRAKGVESWGTVAKGGIGFTADMPEIMLRTWEWQGVRTVDIASFAGPNVDWDIYLISPTWQETVIPKRPSGSFTIR